MQYTEAQKNLIVKLVDREVLRAKSELRNMQVYQDDMINPANRIWKGVQERTIADGQAIIESLR